MRDSGIKQQNWRNRLVALNGNVVIVSVTQMPNGGEISGSNGGVAGVALLQSWLLVTLILTFSIYIKRK